MHTETYGDRVDPEKLKARRAALDLSVGQIAARASITAQAYYALERGVVPEPRISTLRRVARALECEVDDLLVTGQPPDTDTPEPPADRSGG